MTANTIPRPEYPRPDFQRDSFLNLNGEWEFAFDDEDRGVRERWYRGESLGGRITVPYVYQCRLSGVNDRGFHRVVWYQRRVFLPSEPGHDRVLLHFGAADYAASVWVNGAFVGRHEGGHTPFTFDITEEAVLDGENTVTVRVFDDALDLELTRGKQYWKAESEGIFYTGSTGIWQTVWIEQVASVRLEKLWITPDVDRKTISVRMELEGGGEKQVRVRLSLRGRTLADDILTVTGRRAQRDFWLDQGLTLDWNHQETLVWTPENPVLFDLDFEVSAGGTVTDRVGSYCALRKVAVIDGRFTLNNMPYYQRMLLDQGYWRSSLMTAPTDEDFVRDIEACKAMGFNGVRKHQKTEDPRYLYHADRLGLLVWGECASAYNYSRTYVKNMLREWEEIVERDYNHPCIVAWVPLNESWGVDGILNNPEEQSFSQAIRHLTKALDQTRPVMTNDGWVHTDSDLLTVHDYEGSYEVLKKRYGGDLETILRSIPSHRPLFARGFEYRGQPVIVSECGGIAYQKDAHSNGWGYTVAESDEDFVARYRAVVSALMEAPNVQGFVYTQLCDVEQEINGLMTYDRQFKVDPAIIRQINTQGKGKNLQP